LPKVTLQDVANLQNETTAVATLNANFSAIETALDSLLSRDGTAPNTLTADLDMNSNRILNLPEPQSELEPARLADLNEAVGNVTLVDDLIADAAEAVALAQASADSAAASAVEAQTFDPTEFITRDGSKIAQFFNACRNAVSSISSWSFNLLFYGEGPDDNHAAVGLTAYSTTTHTASYEGRSAGGTKAVPLAVAADRQLVRMQAMGYDGAGWTSNARGRISINADEAWTNTATGSRIEFWTTQNGTTTLVRRGRINNDGTLIMGDSAIPATAETTTKFYANGPIATPQLQLFDNRIEEHSTNTDDGSVAINWKGYSSGTTRFRDFNVFDGKSTSLFALDGSTQQVSGASVATAAQFRANTTGRLLTTDQVWSAAAPVTLTSGTTITPDLSTGINFSLTAGHNFTLANPTNMKNGQSGVIYIQQDSTGSRTMTLGTYWKFPTGMSKVLSTSANAIDALYFTVINGTTILCSLQKGYA
jgi:hypothetical protein